MTSSAAVQKKGSLTGEVERLSSSLVLPYRAMGHQVSGRIALIGVRRIIWRITLAAVGFRLITAMLAVLVTLTFPLDRPEQFTVFGSTSVFWDSFARYDSGWYHQIATHGYEFVKGGPSAGIGKPGKIAFFPLYPILMGHVGRLFGPTGAHVYSAASLFLGSRLRPPWWHCFSWRAST